jgi:hypothetical protein
MVVVFQSTQTIQPTTWTAIVGYVNPIQLVDVWGITTTGGTVWKCLNAQQASGAIQVQNTRSSAINVDAIIVRYFETS